MYNAHFGLREKPFKLVPNPDYLFLSKNHEIALAHLNYAVSQGDGFVVITGEVGTGKTTMCRLFLERLGDDVESAYIFNPKLDSVQLLTTICNEFGIRTNFNNLKQLLDVINGYLIMKHQAKSKVILLIDEAQNLSIENLEMVRMLSNLETTRSKLLQIILVGQPELGDMLDSYELRQLAQRISLSTHLMPFSFAETVAYIQHRINIAAQRQANLFTRGACRRIHLFSNGIPRLINIACDRALLSAFSLDRPKVSRAIAKIAVRELASRGRPEAGFGLKKSIAWTTITLAIMAASGMAYSKWDRIGVLWHDLVAVSEQRTPASVPPATSTSDEPLRTYKIDPMPPADTPAAMNSQSSAADGLRDFSTNVSFSQTNVLEAVDALEHHSSRLESVARVLERWRQPPPHAAQLPANVADADYFEIAARQYGLRMYTVQSDWSLIKKMNLPGILAFNKGAGKPPVYMAIVGWEENGVIQLVGGADQRLIRTDLNKLLPRLQGPVYLFWKNVLGFDGIISSGSPEQPIGAVKNLLRRVGYDRMDLSPVFDTGMRQAVLDFQIRHSLEPDGLVGPLTKIFLIKEANVLLYPRLN